MKISLLFTICSITASINAYEFSFFNNTSEPIGIAIQFDHIDDHEPLYKQLIKPKSMGIFTPGKSNIPNIKWGFCLDTVYYTENPTSEKKAHNFAKTTWRKIPITWTEAKSMTKKTALVTTNKSTGKQIRQKKTIQKEIPAGSKSLCRDRHFDITQDEHDKIIITCSLNE